MIQPAHPSIITTVSKRKKKKAKTTVLTYSLSQFSSCLCHLFATKSRNDRLLLSLVWSIQPELHKNDAVLDDGPQGSQQPGEGLEQVLSVLRESHHAEPVHHVSRDAQQEEEKGESLARLLTPVLDDLRDAGAEVADGREVAESHPNAGRALDTGVIVI